MSIINDNADLVYQHQLDSAYNLPKKIQQIANPVRIPLTVATVLAQRWIEVINAHRERLQAIDRQRNETTAVVLVDVDTLGFEEAAVHARLIAAKERYDKLTADFTALGYSLAGGDKRVYKQMDKEQVYRVQQQLQEQRNGVISEFQQHARNFVTLVQDTAASQVKQTKLKLPADLIKRIDEFACKELPAAQGDAIDVEPVK